MILNVNGSRHEVEAGTRTLLEVLRDDLGLVGAKEGCGIGMCGACTVLVDGKPISGCLTLAEQVPGKEILTIESLEKNGQLHPVQQAFIDERAFQCAYCTPGFILSAVALLNENPNPSEDDIREYLSGNLCRCGSYQNILKAVVEAGKRLR
ncbi:MAG: (2Fe-2S)-binding protein [Anaerolineales bacterium]|nr:(2Fe-2S)-binding protein [Anaerolineales bacterium]MDP2776879.1 (2Fe-2S)-binding protein [Anaerolineales bacterium]